MEFFVQRLNESYMRIYIMLLPEQFVTSLIIIKQITNLIT